MNGHLKSTDLFNVAQYPEICFQSTCFNVKDNQARSVISNLTLLGKLYLLP
ncbi:YceI family protein [Neisseria musculi]|uniref:YceI family protein n=1 Tax=Neisseria musculi TaxID=1815583 RepID=UPI001072B99B|nr:YceI family protein [Neisseria sp. 19428wB4_WF04]TFU43168.1 YceI family protein [Neisseria sp. WF04]